MPYLIKIESTKAYVKNFYNKGYVIKASYHKHIKEAKIWKTETGVKNALKKYLSNKDINDFSDLIIIQKSESDLNYLNKEKEEVYIDKPIVEKKKTNIIKIKNFFIKKIKYIIEEIKIYFPQ